MLLTMFFVSTALRFLGFRRVYRLVARSARPGVPGSQRHQLEEAKRTARVLKQVNRQYSLLGNSCLTESLVLWRLLLRRGIGARFKIGVRTLTGPFESHAWVEYEGRVLNDVADVGKIFTPIDLPPPATTRSGPERFCGHRQ